MNGKTIAVALLTSALVFVSDTGDAGSIFMKNGYIIEGRIVDRNDDGLILGWPHGKMTIAHRFVDSVNFEVGEEERLTLLEEARQAAASDDDGSGQISLLSETADAEELPASLDLLISKMSRESGGRLDYLAQAAGLADGADGDVDGGGLMNTGRDAGDVTQTPVVRVDSRPALAEEAIERSDLGVRVRPPSDWVDQSNSQILAFRGSADEGGASSFSVVSLEKGPLSPEQYVDLLREEQKDSFESLEVLSEGSAEIAGRTGYEIVSRGTRGGDSVLVKQTICVDQDRVWLFSVFAPGEEDDLDATMAAVDEAFATLEFLP